MKRLAILLLLGAGLSARAAENTTPAATTNDFIAVESSVMDAVKYDADRRALTIRFDSGETYLYTNVPPAIAEALLAAPSKGRFFHEEIKPVFPGRRLDADVRE